jgi:hypothetical protein
MDKEKTTGSNKRMIAGLVLIALLACVALFQFVGDFSSLWPDENHIKKEIKSLKILQLELQEELNKAHCFDSRLKEFKSTGKDFWIPSRDGKVETEVHKRIEKVAKTNDLTLSNLGSLRNSKIVEGISFMELNVALDAKMEDVAKFMASLQKLSPRFAWDSCSIRPDNLRNPTMVRMNGKLKFICVTSSPHSKLFIAGGKK